MEQTTGSTSPPEPGPKPVSRIPLFTFNQPDGTVCKLYADGLHEGVQPHMFPLHNQAMFLTACVVGEMDRQCVKNELIEWVHSSLIGHRPIARHGIET